MLESQLSDKAPTSPNFSGSLRVQRSLATMLVVPTLIFLMAGLLVAGDIILGDFKRLPLLLVAAGIAFSCGALSYSLFRGSGVPSWFLRALWIMIFAGVVYLTISEISKYLAGERVELAGDLLVFGALVYFCFSTFRDFWTSKAKQPT
jgi:hypothetical protein